MTYNKWQLKIIEEEKQMSNEVLLDTTLGLAVGDTSDGKFTIEGGWKYEYLISKLWERLEEWFNDGN